jgi:alkanesulfonate monooxygenase SsuD/methylene tetrahydromethanopterin reductase-like flavin-dependent oxidoreductase (luciferase family)
MKYGVFDHMDLGGRPLSEQYESRLRLIEAYDRSGFHAFHLAEHHATPLGMAPSPAVFLAAVAQRTKRLRFGPLVYILTLQNPLRAYEEICMLDHLSGGRLELGMGKGVSPIELAYFGADPGRAPSIYQEATAIIMKAFAQDRLTHHGEHFKFADVPIELKPVQRPHPPLWLGMGNPDHTRHAARNKINMVCNGTTSQVRVMTDRYRKEWSEAGHSPDDLPFLGMNRHIVVADTDAEAYRIAKPAYEAWYANFSKLWRDKGQSPPGVSYPPEFDELIRRSFCIVGSPATVRDMIADQIEQAGISYLLCRLAFGNIAYEHAARSVELFATHVVAAATHESQSGRRRDRSPAAADLT